MFFFYYYLDGDMTHRFRPKCQQWRFLVVGEGSFWKQGRLPRTTRFVAVNFNN